jgi:hypothetical protein
MVPSDVIQIDGCHSKNVGVQEASVELFGRFFSRRRVVLESKRYFRPQDSAPGTNGK